MLKIDNLELTKDEFAFVLKYYKKHKKEFDRYKDDNYALQEFLSELVRDYRKTNGYVAPIKVRFHK